MDVGLSRTKISYRWDRRGLSCFIFFYLGSSILTLEPLVMVFAHKFWCSSLNFGVLLQIRFQVQSVTYPPIPVEQPKESKPFAPMVIMVSSSIELHPFKVFHLY